MFKNFLTTLFGLNVYFYGVFLVLCLFIFLFLYWRGIRKTSYSEERLLDTLFVAGLFGLFFGRLLFFMLNPDYFSESVLRFFLLFSFPGVAEFGFWSGFFLSYFIYSRRQKNKFRSLIEILALPVLSTRFLFSVSSLISQRNWGSAIFTLQMGLFLGFYFLFMRLVKKGRAQSTNLVYLLFTALLSSSFIIDFFNTSRLYFFGQRILSVEQALNGLSLLVLFCVLLINFLRGRKAQKKSS